MNTRTDFKVLEASQGNKKYTLLIMQHQSSNLQENILFTLEKN